MNQQPCRGFTEKELTKNYGNYVKSLTWQRVLKEEGWSDGARE
jgi:hypothetical protein